MRGKPSRRADAEKAARLEKTSRRLLEAGDVKGGWRALMDAFALDPRGMSSYAEGNEGGPGTRDDAAAALAALLDDAIEREPDLAEAFAWRAALRRRLLDYAGARDDVDRAWALGLRGAHLLTWRGEARWQLGDVEGGNADLEAALSLPCEAWNHAWCARVQLTLGRDPEAVAHLDRAIALDPGCGWWYAWRGEARRRLRLDADVWKDFETALKLDRSGHRHSIRLWRGLAKLQAGRPREALADLESAREALPRSAPLLRGMADAHRALGEPVRWIELFDRSARLAANLVQHLDALAAPALEAMLGDLESALRSRPRHRLARLWRGFTLMRLGRLDAAVADLDAVLEEKPDPWALAWRGEARCRRGELAAGVEDYGRSLALDGKDAQVWAGRARARLALGETDAALADLDRAIELDRHHGPAFAERGALRLLLGRAAEAVPDLRWCLLKDGRQVAARVDLALALKASGDAAGAGKEWEEASTRDAESARTRLEAWKQILTPESVSAFR